MTASQETIPGLAGDDLTKAKYDDLAFLVQEETEMMHFEPIER